MKKMLVLVGAAVLAAVGIGIAEEGVLSRNVVGVVKVDIRPGGQFSLVSFNFHGVGGQSATLSDLFDSNPIIANNSAARADKIYIYDPVFQSYEIYYKKTDGSFYFATNNTIVASPVISAGSAMWVQSVTTIPTNRVFSFVGEVVSDDEMGRDMAQGFVLFASPYAADFNINSHDWIADGATAHASAARADRIWLWTGKGYDPVFLKPDGKWYFGTNSNIRAENAIVPMGGAAWYQAKKPFSNTLLRPYPWW
jgi:hypothetical protein